MFDNSNSQGKRKFVRINECSNYGLSNYRREVMRNAEAKVRITVVIK